MERDRHGRARSGSGEDQRHLVTAEPERVVQHRHRLGAALAERPRPTTSSTAKQVRTRAPIRAEARTSMEYATYFPVLHRGRSQSTMPPASDGGDDRP